jgi:hypothetical protein
VSLTNFKGIVSWNHRGVVEKYSFYARQCAAHGNCCEFVTPDTASEDFISSGFRVEVPLAAIVLLG